MLAVNFRHLAVAELLLKWGADVNAVDQVGDVPHRLLLSLR